MRIKKIEPPQLLYDESRLTIVFQKGQGKEVGKLYADTFIDPDKEYEIAIKEKKKKRSLDANSYYWELVTQIIEVKKELTKDEYHNKNLANLGIPWRNKDGQLVWYMIKDDDEWLKMKEYHLCPTDNTEDRKGVMYRWFYLLKSSKFMNSKEFSRLIDNAVQDAKTLGIETKTPDEIKRMMATWKGSKE